MIVWEVKMGGALITIAQNTKKPGSPAEYDIKGDGFFARHIKRLLSSASGLYGHTLSNVPAPVDLNAALLSLAAKEKFSVKVVKGKSILDSYRLKLPKGAVT